MMENARALHLCVQALSHLLQHLLYRVYICKTGERRSMLSNAKLQGEEQSDRGSYVRNGPLSRPRHRRSRACLFFPPGNAFPLDRHVYRALENNQIPRSRVSADPSTLEFYAYQLHHVFAKLLNPTSIALSTFFLHSLSFCLINISNVEKNH